MQTNIIDFLFQPVCSPVFHGLGRLPPVPRQLQHNDPHRLHLADSLSGNMEVHHDQVPHHGYQDLHPGEVQTYIGCWIW